MLLYLVASFDSFVYFICYLRAGSLLFTVYGCVLLFVGYLVPVLVCFARFRCLCCAVIVWIICWVGSLCFIV